MKKSITQRAQSKRERYSTQEKFLIGYGIVLLVLFLLMPVIKIDHLGSRGTDLFTIFNGAMTKTRILVLIIVAILLVRNISYKFKLLLHRIFGFTGNDTLVNAGLLFMLMLMFFSIGDSVALLNKQFSQQIGTTSGFLVVGIYLVIGFVLSLIFARLHHKKNLRSQEVRISHEQDHQGGARDYSTTSREDTGFFDENEIGTHQETDHPTHRSSELS